MASNDLPKITEETATTNSSLLEMTKILKTLTDKIDAAFVAHGGDESGCSNSNNSSGAKRSREATPEDSDDEDDGTSKEDGMEGKKPRTYLVSSPTKAFLRTTFCLPKPVDNATRRTWLSKFGLPEGNEARCPKMDSIIKGELRKESLDTDRKLSRLQNFSLDAARPLIVALDELTTKEEPDVGTVTSAIQQGLALLGNASAHFSKER